MNEMKIAFMGTSHFSLKSLSLLYEKQKSGSLQNFEIVAVYTQAPKPSGRNYKLHKSAVYEFAEKNDIPVFTPKSLKNNEQLKIFASLNVDLSIVSSYGLIIPQNILDVPPFGFINIHASLLPRWRGAAPIQAAILAGDSQTGITIMKMDAGVDTGDIISMQSMEISPKTNHGDLENKMGDLGASMIVDTINDLENALQTAYKQPNVGEIYASKISKDICRIDWSCTTKEILQKVMAFAPAPGAWTEIDGLRIKILDIGITERKQPESINAPAENIVGKIISDAGGVYVSCLDGLVKLIKVQPAGKNIMKAIDFLNGRKDFVGKRFDLR